MTERERLIELINDIEHCPEKTCINFGGECKGCKFSNGFICNMTERKAEYLLEHGVIVPPCKSGDTIYDIHNDKIFGGTVIAVCVSKNIIGIMATGGRKFSSEDIGKTVFLTREEAEKALKESENDA